MSMWSHIAHWILDHRRSIVLLLVVLTVFLGYWATQVKTDHTTGNFISAESQAFHDFQRASEVFGESQTILYLIFEDADPYDPPFLQALDTLTQNVSTYEGVEYVLSLTNVPALVRDGRTIVAQPLYSPDLPPEEIRRRLMDQPFLRGLLLSDDGSTTAAMVKIDEVFNGTPARIDLVNQIEASAKRLPGTVALAGFPYLRSHYARRITREAPLFALLALLVALVCLYLTFGAWRAVVLPTVIVGLGIAWTIGLMAYFDHRLTIVSSVLPALLVIIGMANAIHLCTKFFDQYRLLQDQRAALVETIRTVGLATFLTCLTTAIGFGVLVLSGSHLLSAFGQMAAVGIMLLYVLSITLVPIAFVGYRASTTRTAPLTTHDGLARWLNRLALGIRQRTGLTLTLTAGLFLVGLFGLTRISSDIYVFSDFREDDPVRQHLAVFETHFGGILPMELVVEAKKPGAFRSLGSMRRIETLQSSLDTLESVGTTLAATDLVKLANQAYFGGNPAAYRLPSSYELPFLQTALKDFLTRKEGTHLTRNLPLLVDSTFSITRVYLGVLDIGTERMNALTDTARAQATALFPEDQFHVFVTGTAIRTTRSGENLVQNLLISLAVALVIISLLMALLFRSVRLMLISLVPNVIPLVMVGGAMGLTGILLKPSTALIFSIAFGIAVDNTIHFLAKYRLYRDEGLKKEEAIRATLSATGKAILFTSLVLLGGFLTFTFSSFGGTVNMGGLTALTLGVAAVANLFLLPALLYRFGPETHLRPAAVQPPSSHHGIATPAQSTEPG
ncbi:MAG: RND family transporter [Rhodothermales bacterium]